MTRYRYVFADLLTDRTICELPLTGVSFDQRIIVPGALQATIPVPNRAVAEQARKIVASMPEEVHTGPGRTVVYVYRGTDLWGPYLLWTAVPQSDARGRISVALQGATLESYPEHVEIRSDLTYAGADQISGIAAGLVAHMQSDPSADIGLTVTAPASGIPRDRTYKRSESGTYGARLAELANTDDGFEYMIRSYVSGGVRVREWIAAPQLGSSTTDHLFSQPGNVISWSYGSDATNAGTSYQTRGDTVQDDVAADSEPLMSTVGAGQASALLAAGWPRLDKTVDYQSVTDVATLDGYARWWASTRAGAIRIPEVTVRLDERTTFSPGQLGDYAKLKLVNDWFPRVNRKPSFSRRWRVVGAEITPVDRETGQEQARLIFAEEDA